MTEPPGGIIDFSSPHRLRTFAAFGILCAMLCIGYFHALDHWVLCSNSFSPIFHSLLTGYDSQTAWLLLAATCAAAIGLKIPLILSLVTQLGRRPVASAAVVCVLYALGNVYVYHAYPFSMDEYAAVFQSKIFSSGHLYARLPTQFFDWLVVRGFNGTFFVGSAQTGVIIEEYWPGFSLILSVFDFLNVPWLCNPLLAALALWLIHRITLFLTEDLQAAGWAVLFAVASGAFAAYAISFYSMQAHLTLNLLFACLLLQPKRGRALAAGLVGSLALNLHNPLPHALFALPWLLAVVSQRRHWGLIAPLVCGYVPGLAVGLGWVWLRSDIAAASMPQAFSAVSGSMPGIFAWPTAGMWNIRLASLVKLIVWAAPLLLLFAAAGWFGFRRKEGVRLLGWSVALTFGAYFFVTFDQGHGWGHRYFQSAWGALPILAGCAMASSGDAGARLRRLAAPAAALGLLCIVPFQLFQIESVIGEHLALLDTPQRPGSNVYFIRPQGGFYVADMVQMDPFLRQSDLFLVSRGRYLDEALVTSQWPEAVKIASKPAFDQWYLGTVDVRAALIPPSAAGR